MKWLFYVIVFVYMFYRAVYGAQKKDLEVLPISYPEGLKYLPSGSRLIVTCKLSSRNQKVDWLDPHDEVIQHDSTERVYSHRRIAPASTKGSPFLLTFTHAMVEDSGVYTCQSDDDKDKVTLCVIDPARFIDTETDEITDEGRSYTLSCRARGDPQPELIWSKDGEVIDDDKLSSKYKTFQSFKHDGYETLLTITSVSPEDAGDYTCTAQQVNALVEDCFHEDSINITLQVNYKPVFGTDGEPIFIFADVNETVHLDCSAMAFPKATYRWFHYEGDDTFMEYTAKKIKLIEDDTIARLTVFADAESFGQKFSCAAGNDFGETFQEYLLAKLEAPEAPINVTVAEALEDGLIFEFSFNKGSPPPDVILVQYKESDDSYRQPREIEWRRSRTTDLKHLEDDEGHYKLTKLEPDTNYWMRFRTKNSKGSSGWSDPHFVSTRDHEDASTEESSGETSTEAEVAEEDVVDLAEKQSISDGTFYGIFFAGGIVVLGFVCMFAMRMV